MSASTQIKQTVADYGRIIFIILLLAAVGAFAGAGMTYTSPTTETVTEQRYQQQVSAGASTSAVVTEDTELYSQGRRLSGMPVYFLSASPLFTINITTTVPSDQPVAVSQELVLRREATRNGELFWQEERRLFNTTQNTSNGKVTSSTTLNMSEVTNESARLRNLVSIGTFRTRIILRVSYQMERYSGTLSASTEVQTAGDGYWLAGELSASNSHSTTVEREVESRNMSLVGILGGIGLVMLVGAIAIGYWHSQGVNIQDLETEVARDRYEEWISEGELPTGANKQYIYISSLEDLVDVAIDSNKRVIYDDEFSAYSVSDGDLVYYYAENPTMLTSWLELSSDDT